MRQRIAVVVTSALCAACWTVVPVSAQTLAWSVVPSPNRGLLGNGLRAVSCVSPVACTAVGSSGSGQRTLAESWDGSRWSVLPSPNRARTSNALLGVSCASPVACMAVGGSGFSTGGASALSGDTLRTLAESWDGLRWSVLPSPNRGTSGDNFDSVSCTSPRACTAVGAAGYSGGPDRTLVESWDGSRWSVVPSPNPVSGGNDFRGVSCASKDACMAVGFSGSSNGVHATLAEFWDGSRWSVLPSPNPVTRNNLLNGVSCASDDACTAIGVSGGSTGATSTLIESWDGSRWSVVPSPSPGPGLTWLNGVSCASKDACTAVGYYIIRSPGDRTLVESWDGSRWSVVPSPNPGVIDHELEGVSCASETSCTAVGDYYGSNGTYQTYRTLVESGTASG